jgi:glucan phosphoethanolaminetransferase (alkaline phosphatase superfamily)
MTQNRFVPASQVGWTLFGVIGSLILLYGPDLYLYLRHDYGRSLWFAALYAPMALLALALTITQSRVARLLALSICLTLQAGWTIAYAYFGTVPHPPAMLLSLSQAYEIGRAATGETGLLLPPLLAVLFCGLMLLLLHEIILPGRAWKPERVGTILLVIMFTAPLLRVMFIGNYFYAFPDAREPAFIGGYNNLLVASRIAIEDRLRSKPAPRHYTINEERLPSEPLTVVFVMGESVSPGRLGLFDPRFKTTPRLDKRAAGAGSFTLYYKAGFSAGVATIASVPKFMTPVVSPAELSQVTGTTNLFKLARQSGFRTYLYSAQRVSRLLSIAGGFAQFDRLESEETIEEAIETKRDDVLIDLVRETPASARRFFFLHHRVNHAPYSRNCDHVAGLDKLLPPSTSVEDQRRADYDNGLICLDRALDRLLDTLEAQGGAVHVFYTSDHGEMMGEDGLWGHLTTKLPVARVPQMLFTNRPDDPIVRAFSDPAQISAFSFMRLVSRALGRPIASPPDEAKRFYINGSIPFAKGGMMAVTPQEEPNSFLVEHTDERGIPFKRETVTLPKLVEKRAAGS